MEDKEASNKKRNTNPGRKNIEILSNYYNLPFERFYPNIQESTFERLKWLNLMLSQILKVPIQITSFIFIFITIINQFVLGFYNRSCFNMIYAHKADYLRDSTNLQLILFEKFYICSQLYQNKADIQIIQPENTL